MSCAVDIVSTAASSQHMSKRGVKRDAYGDSVSLGPRDGEPAAQTTPGACSACQCPRGVAMALTTRREIYGRHVDAGDVTHPKIGALKIGSVTEAHGYSRHSDEGGMGIAACRRRPLVLAAMFHWRAHEVALLLAPLQQDGEGETQRYVRADVRVDEETVPSYALIFVLAVQSGVVQKRVTKQLLTTVLERVAAGIDDYSARFRTRAVASTKTGRVEYDDAVDEAVRVWLRGKTRTAPSREQLVKWLLSRMVVVCSAKDRREEYSVVLCGEDGDKVLWQRATTERKSTYANAAEATSIPTAADGGDDLEECDLRLSSPPPPPYSAEGSRSYRSFSDVSDTSEFDYERAEGDEGVPDDARGEEEGELDTTNRVEARHPSRQLLDRDMAETQPRSASFVGSAKTSTLSSCELTDDVTPSIDAVGITPPSRYRFEPAHARQESRRRSASSCQSVNAWTEERRLFQLQLTQSKRDLERLQKEKQKADAIAALRRENVIRQTQRKVLAHEQKLRDARVVKQSIADAIEYHTIADRLTSQTKQARITASREQERVVHAMRVPLGRSGDKWQKGAIIGEQCGPLSQIDIDCATSHLSRTEPSPWVYDLHGRRHSMRDAGAVTEDSALDAAMKKIQRVLHRRGAASVDMFRQFDLDQNGTLEYSEFLFLLRQNDVELSREQATPLFKHFDPNGSGAIDYGELLWGFFNRRAFLKRWKQRKTHLSAREIKLLFYKYDRIGRGALSLKDFCLAMDDMGFHVSEMEAKLLCLKFDTNKDGFMDYNEFHAFVNEDDVGGDKRNTEREKRKAHSVRVQHDREQQEVWAKRTTTSGDDMRRILEELKAVSETQAAIERTLRGARA